MIIWWVLLPTNSLSHRLLLPGTSRYKTNFQMKPTAHYNKKGEGIFNYNIVTQFILFQTSKYFCFIFWKKEVFAISGIIKFLTILSKFLLSLSFLCSTPHQQSTVRHSEEHQGCGDEGRCSKEMQIREFQSLGLCSRSK